MTIIPYTETEEYQQEIAEQYKQRIGKFDPSDVLASLGKLGFNSVRAEDLQTTAAGNMNATYLTPELVVKINKKGDMPYYYANKVVSDALFGKSPVVEVLAYDYFDKTNSEILVMRRAPGQSLLDTILDLPQEDVIELFKQVLGAVKVLQTITFDSFGWVNLQHESYPTYKDFLLSEFNYHSDIIKRDKLLNEGGLETVREYFVKHLGIFENEKAVFVHTDAHMGNFLHEGTKLTAVIDFDWSLKAPPVRALPPLLNFLYDPQQFTEGSSYFPKFKGKNFMFLLPTLKQMLPELFEDGLLLKKLNLMSINDGIMWISENWSAEWNKGTIKNIIGQELAESDTDLKQTYFGKLLTTR